MKITAIVPAAGAGLRISKKKGERKPFFVLRDKPILIHTLLALEGSGRIGDIILAVHKDDIGRWDDIVKRFGLNEVSKIIPGGKTRFESVRKSLSFVADNSDIVFIHDGVRPLIDERIERQSVNVDAVSGATISSEGLKTAVGEALQKAELCHQYRYCCIHLPCR